MSRHARKPRSRPTATTAVAAAAQPERGRRLCSFAVHLGAVLLASLLFAAAFPNILVSDGLPWLAWIAYVPLFWLIRRISLRAAFFWGALYGYVAYGLFNYWLSVFHPLAGIIVGAIYLVYLGLLFPLLKAAIVLFPRRGYIVQWLLWMGYEYLRTLGFVGYAYGITGYTQWAQPVLIQIAALGGVWAVSALVVFPSAYIGNALATVRPQHAAADSRAGPYLEALLRDFSILARQGMDPHTINFPTERTIPRSSAPGFVHSGPAGAAQATAGIRHWYRKLIIRLGARWQALRVFCRRELLAALVWALVLIASLVYGLVAQLDYRAAPTVRLALIQHNTDPWVGGLTAYRRNFDTLQRLSLEAMEQERRPDLVVWSETAFVPCIHWHLTYREDQASLQLVRELITFLRTQDVPYVIGNHDARMEPGLDDLLALRNYNAVLLFEGGQERAIYRKLHLVPFAEHFPYERWLPSMHRALVEADTHFWDKGREATVMEAAGVRFSTPICFEDSFGYLSRDFVRAGAQIIINLTNDAWANSRSSQLQHMGMAVFRAVENRRSLVRATTSGQTCAVDPNGRILAMAPAFTEAQLTVDVPVVEAATLYTALGDWLGQAFAVLAGLTLLAGVSLSLAGRQRLE